MVGLVIVSHSRPLAEGVAQLAREMGGSDVRIETAGGLDMPDHPLGTDAVLVSRAIELAWSSDGVLVLMDLGSAVLSAEMALELLPDDVRSVVVLCEAPIVEGAIAAAVTARTGASIERVAEEARGGLAAKAAHLAVPAAGASGIRPEVEDRAGGTPDLGTESERSLLLVVDTEHGLHARPAARFVQTAGAFDAEVRVRNVTAGRGPADARSLNGVATLGVVRGDEIEVRAAGRQAGEVIDAIRALAARNFDDVPETPAPRAGKGAGTAPAPGALRGIAASPGIAIGAARRFHVPPLPVPAEGAGASPGRELARLEEALRATRAEIEEQRATVAARAGGAQAAIFEAHLLFLQDTSLLDPARAAIRDDGRSAPVAWDEAVERTASSWGALSDAYQRARVDDLRSVGQQVLAHLLGVSVPRPRLEAPGILVAPDLTPADAAGLDPSTVLGIATASGGATSHASILARSLGIPAVVGAGDEILEMPEETTLVVDGRSGLVHVDPEPEVLAELTASRDRLTEAARRARRSAHEPAVTRDGLMIEVAANIGAPDDVSSAVESGADAVGLFRTEFLFLDRSSMPDEDEQAKAYARAAEALGGRPMIVRTLDVGADKPVPYLAQRPEVNPFLGVRGVRLGLTRPDVLRTQLRAIARTAAEHPVRIMFPMVATAAELDAARRALDEAVEELASAGMTIPGPLSVGVMVEVPAIALIAERIAPRVDFFSIGTNDLTQYVMAADRGNEDVAALSDALSPAVLRLIHQTVQAAEHEGRWVGVCGELAADPLATPLLIGLGVRELSMSPPAIPEVKQAVREIELSRARSLAESALELDSAEDVRALLRRQP